MDVFSRNLLICINKKAITYSELAMKTGLSSASICAYISRKRQPTLKAIKKLCSSLEVSPNYLLGYEEPSELTYKQINMQLNRIENKLSLDKSIFKDLFNLQDTVKWKGMNKSIQINDYFILYIDQSQYRNNDYILLLDERKEQTFICRLEIWVYGYNLIPIHINRRAFKVPPDFGMNTCHGRVIGIYKIFGDPE